MNINLSVLVSELRKHYHVQCNGYFSQCVSGINLIEDDMTKMPLERDKLNIFRLRSLSQIHDSPLQMPVLCVVHPDNIAITDNSVIGTGTFIVVYAEKLERVLMTLSGILYRCGQMTSALEDMSKELLSCRTLEQALAVGYKWMKNPMIIADNQHAVLAHTDSSFISFLKYEDMWMQESIFPSRDSINITIHAMEQSMLSSWPSSVTASGNVPHYLCKTLCSSGRVDGFLFLYLVEQEEVENVEAMLELMGNFCAVLLRDQISLQNTPRRKRDQLGLILQMMLDEVGITRSQMERHIEKLQLHFKPYRYILSVQPTDQVPSNLRPVHGLIDILSAAVPNTLGTYYRNKLTLLIESDQEIRDFSKTWAPLAMLLREFGFRAGVSNVCRDIMELKDYFYQAQRAVELGCSFYPNQVLVPYYQCIPYHILELASTYENPLHFCDPGILQIQSLDKKNDTELLNTLQVYLESGRNKVQTAQKLYLHLNTVKYRLNQIGEVINLQYSSLEEELRLYLSILILRYTKQIPGSVQGEKILRLGISGAYPPEV